MNESAAPNFQLTESSPWYRKSKTKWLLLLALVLAILGMWTCGTRMFRGTKLAKLAGDRFHAEFNRNEYHQIYVEAAEEFRAGAGPESELNAFFQKVPEKLGDSLHTSEPAFFTNVSDRGTFVTLTYQTDFAKGKAGEKFV